MDNLALGSLFKREPQTVHLALLDVETSKKIVKILKNIVLDEGTS